MCRADLVPPPSSLSAAPALTPSHPTPQFLAYGFHPLARARLAHIPGPAWHESAPFLGQLPSFKRQGQVAAFAAWRARFGPVYKVFLGATPLVVVTDPAEGRRVNLRNHARHPLLVNLSASPSSRLATFGLFAAGAGDRDLHRELKAAWLPFFAGAALDACTGEMARGAHLLGDRLAEAASAGAAVDVWRLYGSLTLTVVAATAFGLDMPTGIDGGASSPEAAALLGAAQTIFATGRSSSAWALVLQAFPRAGPLVRAATRWAPGPALEGLDHARERIMATGAALVAADREREECEGEEGEKDATASAKGSFLSLFARRARRAAEKGDTAAAAALADPAVITAQCFTFLLAGYETT